MNPYELDHQFDREVGAFGEQITSKFTPQCGWIFAYNLNPDIVGTLPTGSGTITHVKPFARIATGTTPNSTAQIFTLRSNRYIPGMGAVAKFTAIFSPPVLGTYQYKGVGDLTDGFFVGYDETAQFGFFRFCDGVKYPAFRLWKNATLTSSNFTDVDATRLPLQKDSAATAFSGGKLLRSWQLGKSGQLEVHYDRGALFMNAGDVFTITAQSSTSTDVSASINVFGEL